MVGVGSRGSFVKIILYIYYYLSLIIRGCRVRFSRAVKSNNNNVNILKNPSNFFAPKIISKKKMNMKKRR